MSLKIAAFLDDPIDAFNIDLASYRQYFATDDVLWLSKTESEFHDHLPEADIAVVWQFSESDYQRARALKAVFTPAAGKDWVAADPSGRVPVYRGSFHGEIMAESLLAMMLYFNVDLSTQLKQQQLRQFERQSLSHRRLLRNQTALIVGFGEIGRRCGERLSQMGMQVAGIRRCDQPYRDRQSNITVYPLASLLSLLADADHVINILPGEAREFFNIDHFRQMQTQSYFYNLGRGSTVNEADLILALEQGQIAGAGLDVFATEPLPSDHPFWQMAQVLISPHSACIYQDYGRLFVDDMMTHLNGLR